MSVKVIWPRVVSRNGMHPVMNWIDLSNVTMFRICAFFVDRHSGYPATGLVVGIERKGMWFFKEPHQYLRFDYVAEKLNLSEPDAAIIADWINAQFEFKDAPQQGIYNETCIEEVEPYGLGGENVMMPLVPKIIKICEE